MAGNFSLRIFVKQIKKNNMNQSVTTIFNQVVSEFKIDLNSKYRLEAELCISKMFDKLDLSGMNVYEIKLFVKKVESFVYSQFNSLPL